MRNIFTDVLNYFRIMLLEALEQLCATKRGREILREKNTYIILRELHKSEKCKEVLLACENVVDILIRYLLYYFNSIVSFFFVLDIMFRHYVCFFLGAHTRTEEEIGLDNIKEVDVPMEYKDKFQKMDEEFVKNT